MKATITILAAVLTLNTGILFAGNETISAPVTNESSITMIAPITPAVATFEDFIATTVDIATLAPSFPLEADFNDITPEVSIDLVNLAPMTPAVADFSDSIYPTIDISALAPTTPAAADFE